nr:protein kinase [Deltaproteobacteria bacterium]
ALLGLAGLAVSSPAHADSLAHRMFLLAPLDVAEAIAELRREESTPLLPGAGASALAWVREQMSSKSSTDDGRLALLEALDLELGGRVRSDGVAVSLARARTALDVGDTQTALAHAREAVDEIAAAAEWLAEATDDEPVDRRHSMRLLRELDRELLADNALTAVLALAPDTDPARPTLASALATIESALLAQESRPEAGPVQHGGLRIARLRALVRLLDGVRKTGEGDLAPRLAAVRLLMLRAAFDHSQLRRAVWAAMTRAGDALLRDDHAEITDLLFVWTTAFPDDDFAVVCEASMIPEVVDAFAAYTNLKEAAWAAADPDDTDAVRSMVERLAELADALPPEQSPRVESVRLALARLGNRMKRVTLTPSLSSLEQGTFDMLATELAALARRSFGAHQRLGLDATDRAVELETAARAVDATLSREPAALDEALAVLIDVARAALPLALAAAVERVVLWIAHRPRTDDETNVTTPIEVMLPSWVPLSRLLGGFHVLRPIGRGAVGSVLLAVRAENKNLADRELVALKAPDYSGGAARNLSEAEFEALFREEAGALLALPHHRNLSRFITFDAAAQPKPILVMEYVRGTTLERAFELRALDTPRALTIIDDLLAGLEAMHKVRIAHLDVKPANIILREKTGEAVLVDFGLAGRTIRTGCGSVHYGANEVWAEGGAEREEPFPADVYAAACVAFEILTDTVLFRGETINELIAEHFADAPGAAVLAMLDRNRRLAPFGALLRAALTRDAKKRPTIARFRLGFSAIMPELSTLPWPIVVE